MPSALRIKELRNLSDNVLLDNGTLTNNVQFPAGHVIQVQSASTSTEVGLWTTSTWVDTGLSVTITPKFNNSKIYLHSGAGVIVNNSLYMGLRINRSSPNATPLLPMITYSDYAIWTPGTTFYMTFDTPTTTLPCTYMLQIYRSGSSAYWNYDALTTPEAHLIAMEIKQ